MNDHVPFIGAGGTLASLGLGTWNEIVGITVGCMTAVYLAIKIFFLLRKECCKK